MSTRRSRADRLTRAVRRSDVPGRLDAALGTATEAVSGVVDRLPGRRRPSRRLLTAVAGVAFGLLAALGVAAWWLRRRAGRTAEGDVAVEERTFDQEAIDRAGNEGMTPAVTATEQAPPSNGTVRDAIGDLV